MTTVDNQRVGLTALRGRHVTVLTYQCHLPLLQITADCHSNVPERLGRVRQWQTAIASAANPESDFLPAVSARGGRGGIEEHALSDAPPVPTADVLVEASVAKTTLNSPH